MCIPFKFDLITVRLLCLLAWFYPLSSLAETTQLKAQIEAETMHRKASDLSMQNSTTSAMVAVMNLAALNIPGAITNGYDSYGSYKNSEEFDISADVAKNLVAYMKSSGALNGAVQTQNESAIKEKKASGISGLSVTETSFSRLDPSFLRSGKAGEIAAEFEKKSGMPREEFLQHLALATDNYISTDDPQMMEKILARFDTFAARIPNAEFRKNLEKGAALIPQSARSGLLAQAIQKFSSGFVAVNGVANFDEAKTTKPEISKKEIPMVKEKVELKVEEAQPRRTIASVKKAENMGLYIGLDNKESTPLEGILKAAMEDKKNEDSIFAQVSKKYKLVAPSLIVKTNNAH